MKLKLNKPLIVFDLETTGVNVVHDHIVELAYIKVWPDGHEEDRVIRINPGVPIPEASTSIISAIRNVLMNRFISALPLCSGFLQSDRAIQLCICCRDIRVDIENAQQSGG